jgi:hypothetical protein
MSGLMRRTGEGAPARSAAFLVNGVLPFKLAELFDLETTGSILLLLGRRVVPAFALGAFKNNDFAHGGICFLRPLLIDSRRRLSI